jgi:Flp pilus assembly protein TadD
MAARPVRSGQPLSKSASGGTNQDSPEPTLEAKVQQLKDDGNWNVLVLYAAKWTREQPNNAVAWNELSIGYANLRQFNDALDAATKAVEVSPGASLLWRNLGHLNLTVERLPEAATAFDRALAMTSDDEDALCGAALVAQKQGRAKDADAIARQLKSTDGSCPGLSDGASVGVVAGGVAARKGVSSVVR